MAKKSKTVSHADIILLQTKLMSIRMDARNNISLHLIIPSVNALETSEMIKACNRTILTFSKTLLNTAVHKKMAAKVLRNYITEKWGDKVTQEEVDNNFENAPTWLSTAFEKIDADVNAYIDENEGISEIDATRNVILDLTK